MALKVLDTPQALVRWSREGSAMPRGSWMHGTLRKQRERGWAGQELLLSLQLQKGIPEPGSEQVPLGLSKAGTEETFPAERAVMKCN